MLSPGHSLTQRVTTTLLPHRHSLSCYHLATLSLRGSLLPFSLTGIPCLAITWPLSHSEGHYYPSPSPAFPVLLSPGHSLTQRVTTTLLPHRHSLSCYHLATLSLRVPLLPFSLTGIPCLAITWPLSHSEGHYYPSLSPVFPVLLSPGHSLTQRVTTTLLPHWHSLSCYHLASLSLRGSLLPFSLTGIPCLAITWPLSHSLLAHCPIGTSSPVSPVSKWYLAVTASSAVLSSSSFWLLCCCRVSVELVLREPLQVKGQHSLYCYI